MNGDGIQPVMNVGGGNGWGDGFGSFGGIIGLLAVLGIISNGGFGFGGNNRGGNSDALTAAILASNNNGFANAIGYENLATQSQVDRGFDAQNSMANQREILSAVTNGTAQSVAATNSTFHDTLAVLNDKYAELQRDIAANAVTLANLNGSQQKCCCDIQMLVQQTAAATDAAIAQTRYENAMGLAGLEQRLTSKMDANTIQNLRDQVDALRDQVNMSGVLRFPNQWSYGAGPFPPIFGGCCGNNGFNNI